MSSNITSAPSIPAVREVAFIDSRVQDIDSFLRDLGRDVEVVHIDATQDGLAQMAAALGEKGDVAAVHVLAHGSAGSMLLGSTVLDGNLAAHGEQLAAIGRAMAPDGDLLVYACELGAGAAGTQFVSTLAQLTGADVAASIDLTGAAALGGNWTLETHMGNIEASPLALTAYAGVLDVLSFVHGVDGDDLGADIDGNGNPLTIVKTVSGINITFAADDPLYVTKDNVGLWALTADHNSYMLTVSAAPGYSFDLSTVQTSSFDDLNATMTITYADGTTAPGSLAVKGSQTTPTAYASTLGLNDIKSVKFTALDYVTFQDFNITDVKLLPPPPPTTVVNGASLSDDTGTSGSDFITNAPTQTITGALSANLAIGEKVEVSYNNGGNWSDATSYTVGASTWSTSTSLSGTSTFLARVSNSGGSSTPYSHSYMVDTVAPTTSFTGIALSADTGVSSSDLITKTAAQTISATLSGAPAGTDIVWGSTDGGGSWTNITSKVSGTTLSWNGATLGAGPSIKLKVSDVAGNDSALSVQTYTLDTTAPTTTIASASFSNDSGTLPTDFITNMASQTVSGSLSANMVAGDRVYVSLDNGATWAAATTTVGQATWSLGGATLSTSSTLKVKVSDTAGNDSTVLSQAYVYDTAAPATTFSGLSLSADTGASSTDFITKTASQTIGATLSGALAGGDILYGSLDNGGSWTDITSKVSGTTLSWNGVTLTASDTLQLKVVDAAGNQGSPQSKAYTLDTSPPATPGMPDLATASDTGSLNNDHITLDTTPTLSGTAENGSTVTLYDGVTMLGTVVAGAGGWTYTTGVLAQGDHTITAVSTDTAGNASGASTALTITVDSTAPTVTSVAVPGNGTYYTGGALDFTVNFSEAVIVGSFGGTPRIALVVGATTRYADYVSGSGTSALLFRYTVPNGDIDANGVAVGVLSANGGLMQDAAGNDIATTLNSVGSTAAINVDGSQPSITGVGASTADGSYGAGQTITITVDFSSAVTVDTTGGTPTLALNGGGSATYTGGSGSSTLTFSYTVGAGQNSADLDYSATNALALNGATIVEAGGAHLAASVVLATPGTAGSLGASKDIVIDTAAPTNTVAGAAFSADTGSSGSDFITKTAAQTISGTLGFNLVAGENVYVSLDNGGSWALATASTGANTWSLAGQTLTGNSTLKVRLTDDAGNNGTAYSHTYVLDTTAPAISFSSVALWADTGTSATDLITNTAAQTISATLSAAPSAGDIVYGSLDNGATWRDITSKVSGTTLSWNGVTLAASDTLQLRVIDAAGNNGAATSKAYVLDTSAPSTSVASVAFSHDSGASASDFITNTAAQTVSGTLSANLAAGEIVQVSLDNGASWVAAAATVGSNSWSLAGRTLTGSDTLMVKVSDTAGNDGAVISQAYVYDTATTAAGLSTATPANNATAVPVNGGIVVQFAPLAAGETFDIGKVHLMRVGSLVPIAATITPAGIGFSITPAANLTEGATYYLAWEAGAIVDLAGNQSGAITDGSIYQFTTVAPPDPGTPPTAPGTPIDGVPVVTEPGPGGSTIITIPVVTPTRPDTPGTPSPLADIPLVTSPTSGQPIVSVSVPTGVGLQAEGLSTTTTGSAALAELGLRIERIAGNNPELTNAGQVFFASMPPNEPLSVQILKPTIGAGYDASQPLVINGSTNPADGKQAVIIDARLLPSGTVIQVDNIEFIAVVGNVRLIGGAGQNAASGDSGAQYIVLGPDDDIIHGGGGNDTVGSEAGDDQVYGDAGDDIVFGGAGNDLLSGGIGSDRLNGGTGFDVAIQEGKRTDYTVTLEGNGIRLTHTATGVSDWLVDVEQVRFATGPSLTVAHSAAEEAAAFLFQKWIGRDLSQAEGAVIQTLTGQSALQVATLFAQVFAQQSAGKTPAQLLEGMADAGAIRVDAVRDVTVTGDAGNNTIIPTLGLARYVDGGAGIDTVVIPATLAQTHLQANGGGNFTLQRMTDGAMLDLTSVERINLSDTKLALDLNGHAGEAAKLLGALGGPAILSNKGLVGEVIRALDAGVSSQALAGIGLQALGAQTPAQVAQLLWTNVVGRAGTAQELQPLVDLMGQGILASDLAVMAGNLDLNATRIDLVGLTAKGIEFA